MGNSYSDIITGNDSIHSKVDKGNIINDLKQENYFKKLCSSADYFVQNSLMQGMWKFLEMP